MYYIKNILKVYMYMRGYKRRKIGFKELMIICVILQCLVLKKEVNFLVIKNKIGIKIKRMFFNGENVSKTLLDNVFDNL